MAAATRTAAGRNVEGEAGTKTPATIAEVLASPAEGKVTGAFSDDLRRNFVEHGDFWGTRKSLLIEGFTVSVKPGIRRG